MAKLSNYQRAAITAALKRSNQRLAEISKHLPNKLDTENKDPITGKAPWIYSSIQKQQIAPFVNSEYADYIKESKSGNPTFDIRKILKDIESGDMDPSETNDFLVKAAGLRFGPEGDITQTETGGIAKIKDLKAEAKEAIGRDLPTDQLLKDYDTIVEIREEFAEDYEDYQKEFGKDTLRNNPITAKLFNPEDEKGSRGTLVYEELKEIHQELKKGLNKRAQRAKNLGKSVIYGGNK